MNGGLELSFEERDQSNEEEINSSEEYECTGRNSQFFNSTNRVGQEILICDNYQHQFQTGDMSVHTSSDNNYEGAEEEEDVAIFKSQKNDIPEDINDKELHIRQRLERRLLKEGY